MYHVLIAANSPWALCVAPMLDWTDRHCRVLHRKLTPHARLYSEMVTTGALLHGDLGRHLDFSAFEHPVALQLGGSEPAELARCARLAQRWGYAEVNLNCGCPSERVQRGAFGACLMREAALVADGWRAMRDVVDVPVTIKHRIGLDDDSSEALVQDFVGQLYAAGCRVFIVHARNAWLKGLSPKENRDVPPLRYAVVHRLQEMFADATFVLNGGLSETVQVQAQWARLPGVMIGRQAYQTPLWLAELDALRWGDPAGAALDVEALQAWMVDYMVEQARQSQVPWWAIARHMLGLRHGRPGARHWRQVWSDHRLKNRSASEVAALANG